MDFLRIVFESAWGIFTMPISLFGYDFSFANVFFFVQIASILILFIMKFVGGDD